MHPEGMQLVQMTVILKVHGHQVLWPHPHAAVFPIEAYSYMPCITQSAGYACNADMPLKRQNLSASPTELHHLVMCTSCAVQKNVKTADDVFLEAAGGD